MDMNSFWIQKALEYHGLPLKSIWEGERGEHDLYNWGLDLTKIDYTAYHKRQKSLRLEDRGFRLKLHQFIAKNAAALFDPNLVDSVSSTTTTTGDCEPKSGNSDYPVIHNAPPFECFIQGPAYRCARVERVINTVRVGDLVYGKRGYPGVKPAGIVGKFNYYVQDLNLKVCHSTPIERISNTVPVVCEIESIDRDYNFLVLGAPKEVSKFPDFITLFESGKVNSYRDYFDQSEDFKNPHCEKLLYANLGLSPREYYTNMANARGRYPPQEYADDIRQKQASKLAFRSVAEGIEHFKEGRHSEAFQCLNKALSIDARNVEGLVARGALHANSGSFKKAVEDFENALKLNPAHANARKYMGETLVALGRSYEEENHLEAAKKAYQDCLMIIPHHEEASTSLEFLKSKMKAPLIEPGELQLPEINFGDGSKKDESSSKRSGKDKKGKKKKAGKSKKKYSSSSSSSPSSDDNEDNGSSDDSSDSSSNSSSSSDSDSLANKKRQQKKKDKKRAPSPPSLLGGLSVGAVAAAGPPPPPAITNDYELKVRNFLSEMTRDEDNYEEKVRRFVEETSKYRKDREKAGEKKKRRKKEKESKKSKKEKEKKKKKEKGGKKEKKSKGGGGGDSALAADEEKLREALKIFENFPILDELGSKLKSMYGKDKKGEAQQTTTAAASMPEQGKWKMMFAKDSRGPEPSTSKATVSSLTTTTQSSKQQHQQSSLAKSAFGMDSDEERRRSRGSKKSPSPVLVPIPPRPKFARLLSPASMNRPAPIRSGPVVLDKFGNFRLANAEPDPEMEKRNRRSRSRRRSSSSRSRSPGRRRRSRSFRSRSRSRSSRSYSRSRSRSRSAERWGRRFRGGRSGFDRQPYFKNRFNQGGPGGGGGQRGGRGGGGRGGGREWEFRGGRGGNRDGFRPRGGGRGNGGRFERRFDRLSRSRSFSPAGKQRSPDGRQRSPEGRQRSPLRGRSPEARTRSPRQRSADGAGAGRQRSPAKSPSSPPARERKERKERRSVSKESSNRKERQTSPRKSSGGRRSPSMEKATERESKAAPVEREAEPVAVASVAANNHHDDGVEPPPPGCE